MYMVRTVILALRWSVVHPDSHSPFPKASRKRSISSSPTNSTSDLNNVSSNALTGNGSQETTPQLPDKKIKAAEDAYDYHNKITNGEEPTRSGLRPHVSLLESSSLEPSIHDVETEGMTTEKLVNYVRLKGKKGLMRLYGILRSEDHEGSYVAARYRQNMHKNRYMDVLALDSSRVHLSVQNGDPYSEYINANYVDGYRHKKAYVSTQGPLAKTYADFWRMVWESQTVCIVMTTRCVERRTIKCGRYWPDVDEGAKAETYDNVTVTVKDVESFGDYVVTELILTHSGVDIVDSKTSSTPASSPPPPPLTRRVYHLQFLSWPDYGVPLSAAAMLDFLAAAREHQKRGLDALESSWRSAGGDGRAWRGHPEGPPIVIHCSAGIGRTGTFIATDVSTRRLKDIGTVDVDKTVRRIRTQRASSIQMPDQYVFIHQAVLEFAQREGLLSADAIRLDGFDEESDESPDDST